MITIPNKGQIEKEYYRSLSFMNIDKILNKIPANQIQEHTQKKIFHYDEVGSSKAKAFDKMQKASGQKP